MRLCAEADAFRKAEKDFAYAIAMAKELGFRYIEPEVMTGRCLLNVYGYCNITSLEDDPMEMRKTIEAAGMKAACLSAHSSLLDTVYGVDYLKKAIRYAYILGAPIVNTAEGQKPGWMTDRHQFRHRQRRRRRQRLGRHAEGRREAREACPRQGHRPDEDLRARHGPDRRVRHRRRRGGHPGMPGRPAQGRVQRMSLDRVRRRGGPETERPVPGAADRLTG
jgi:hypothetical protein